MPKTLTVPAAAFLCEVGEFQFGDNGDDAKTAPLHLVALSGKMIDHWWYGPIIHDLAGMTHKPRIPVDYRHDPDQVIGYVNKFETGSNQLVLDGALVPFGDSDRATELIHKNKNGVPYQASIDWRPSRPGEVRIQVIGKNESVEVNGHTVTGPCRIVRKWKLGGVAVCPYGADDGTKTKVQNAGEKEEFEVDIDDKTKGSQQKETGAAVEGQQAQQQTAGPEAGSTAGTGVEATPKTQGVVAEPGTTQGNGPAQFKLFCDEFGDARAAEYFKQGLSIEDARKKCVADLRTENEQFRKNQATVKAAGGTGGTGVEFQLTDGDGGGDGGGGGAGLKTPLNRKEIEQWCKKFGGDPDKMEAAMKEEAKKRRDEEG